MFNKIKSYLILKFLFMSLLYPLLVHSFNGERDPTFNVEKLLTSDQLTIRCSGIQSSGKFLVCGNFQTINGVSRPYLARLNADGSIDKTFNIDFPVGGISSMVVLKNDQVLIAGILGFPGETTDWRLLRVGVDGALDKTFKVDVNGIVRAIAVQSDNKILIGGNFTTVNDSFRQNLIRLNSNGSTDFTFSRRAGANGQIYSIASQEDGKILIGGHFTKVNRFFNSYDGVERNRVARFNQDGSLDSSFSPSINNLVSSIVVQDNGKIIIGGSFTEIDNTIRNRIARLNVDGSLEEAFNPSSDSIVNSIVLRADNKILVGGGFGIIGNKERARIARLNQDGSVDTTFTKDIKIDVVSFSAVHTITLQSDGHALIGGSFFTKGNTNRDRLALINTSGGIDLSFAAGEFLTGARLSTMVMQKDNKIVIGGNFTSIGGYKVDRVARLNTDGSVDTSFRTRDLLVLEKRNADYINVNSIAIQQDDKILVGLGRRFDQVSGRSSSRLVRLHIDGRLDNSFRNPFLPIIRDIVIQPDRKIIIAGAFSSINDRNQSNIARLDIFGNTDTSFSLNASIVGRRVNSLVVQPDGKILIAGDFSEVSGSARKNLARLNDDGTLDFTFFNDKATDEVTSLLRQNNGNFIVGGGFRTLVEGGWVGDLGRTNSDGLLDLSFAPKHEKGTASFAKVFDDDSLLVAGFTELIDGVHTPKLKRFTRDGLLDKNFNSNVSGFVTAIDFQSDGQILLAGSRISVNGSTESGFVRLKDSPVSQVPPISPGVMDEGICIPIASKNERISVICL